MPKAEVRWTRGNMPGPIQSPESKPKVHLKSPVKVATLGFSQDIPVAQEALKQAGIPFRLRVATTHEYGGRMFPNIWVSYADRSRAVDALVKAGISYTYINPEW